MIRLLLSVLKTVSLSICLGLGLIASFVLLGFGLKLSTDFISEFAYQHPTVTLSCATVMVAGLYGYLMGCIFKFWK
jgi:type IV secretory pathway TrbL component